MNYTKRFFLLFFIVFLFFSCGESKIRKVVKEAERHYQKRSYLKALLLLNDYKDKDNVAVQYLLGKTYLGLKNLSESEERFVRTIELDSSYIDSVVGVCLRKSREMYNVGEEDITLQIFKFLYSIVGANEEKIGIGYKIPALVYYNNGEYAAAEKMFVKALKYTKDKEERKNIWEKILKIEIELKDWHKAFIYGDKAIGEGFVELKNFLGQSAYTYSKELYSVGNKDSAFIIVEKVIELQSPTILMPRAYLFYGDLLLDRGEYEGAMNAYREVLKLVLKDDDPVAIEARSKMELIRGMGK